MGTPVPLIGSLEGLGLAVAVFVATHMGLAHGEVRRRLVRVLGLWVYRGAYSLIAVAALAWAILAWTEAPVLALWPAGTTFSRHLALGLMPLATVLLVGGYTVANPTALVLEDLGGDAPARPLPGILRVTRHPVMWAVALWAVLHVIAAGDAAGLIFFGGLAVLALAGARHMDERKLDAGDPTHARLMLATSFVPFAALLTGRTRDADFAPVGVWRIAAGLALYAVLVWAHGPVIGASLLPAGW